MSRPRVFSARTDREVALDGSEAHYLLHVLRVAVGDGVELFDGAGNRSPAVVTRLSRNRVELRAESWRPDTTGEYPFLLRIVSALPKGKRLDWMLEKLTELSVAELCPLRSERTVRAPRRSAKAADGLGGEAEPDAGGELGEAARRTVIEAARQCRRSRLMRLVGEVSLAELTAGSSTASDAGRNWGSRWLATPGAQPPSVPIATTEITGLIGPEGGFSSAEQSALVAAGWRPVGLGPAILRIETAALALAATLAVSATVSSASSSGAELGRAPPQSR